MNDKNIVPLVRVPCSSSSLSSNFSYPNFLNCAGILSLKHSLSLSLFSFLFLFNVSIHILNGKMEITLILEQKKKRCIPGIPVSRRYLTYVCGDWLGKERGVDRRKEIAVEEGEEKEKRTRKKNEERP